MNTKTLTETRVAYALGEFYSGPFLLPRVVSLRTDKQGRLVAEETKTFQKDDLFFTYDLRQYPPEMLFTHLKQLGLLAVMETLGAEKNLSQNISILMVNNVSEDEIFPGDTATFSVTLLNAKENLFSLDGRIYKKDRLIFCAHLVGKTGLLKIEKLSQALSEANFSPLDEGIKSIAKTL